MRPVSLFLTAAFWLLTLACNEDPARSVKIISRPPQQPLKVAETSAAAPEKKTAPHSRAVRVARRVETTGSATPGINPVAEFCPPAAEDSNGPGSLAIAGPCTFEHRAEVKCESSPDDFIAGFVRKARRGATVAVYINVEHYHGPGSYDGTQMFVAVQSGAGIYRWSNDNVRATVSPGEAFLELPAARLDAEPMLINCSRLIGPESNYQYQCGGQAGGSVAFAATPETVSGRLQCAQAK
jgi:hypothetical protein